MEDCWFDEHLSQRQKVQISTQKLSRAVAKASYLTHRYCWSWLRLGSHAAKSPSMASRRSPWHWQKNIVSYICCFAIIMAMFTGNDLPDRIHLQQHEISIIAVVMRWFPVRTQQLCESTRLKLSETLVGFGYWCFRIVIFFHQARFVVWQPAPKNPNHPNPPIYILQSFWHFVTSSQPPFPPWQTPPRRRPPSFTSSLEPKKKVTTGTIPWSTSGR